ncbi:hypothetical protein [Hufsiella ginkgonis]|uniref:Uncharacterized protein n=1 Tax=Hufsiella ginkgonis TaxID=2695274 RepID=A0A7K1Y0V7_9SPHI|nr:hypothetical protein [Hufsiella ginkgonis]MXV16832.1 hypothetical protein [Hufsiella ginkgonis]
MKTNLEIVQIVYDITRESQVASIISGSVYKLKRIDGSHLEDVVINCLGASNEAVQYCLVNINIHVPNLVLSVDGANVDRSQVDFVRLNQLTKMVIEPLKDYWGDDYNIEIDQVTTFEERDIFEHYQNIRLNFRTLNK